MQTPGLQRVHKHRSMYGFGSYVSTYIHTSRTCNLRRSRATGGSRMQASDNSARPTFTDWPLPAGLPKGPPLP